MKINGRLIVFTLLLTVLATACKFFFGPNLNWSGFSPIIAIALFSGFIIRQKDFSFLLPLIALLASDAVIQLLYELNLFPYGGFYSGQWKNYLILFSATVIGWALKGRNTRGLILGVLVAPTLFFLLSNLNVWSSQEVLYSKDFSGLVKCYTAGLPFYRNSLIATIIFLPLILVAYNVITRNKPVLTVA